MGDNTDQYGSEDQINIILKKASSFIQEKDYKKAAVIVKQGLETYPKQKELLNLFEEIKKQYKDDKIQKLQDEAVMHLRAGDEDTAQKKLRQVLQLDPSRTELRHSLKKTSSEKSEKYNKRTKRMELVRLGSSALLAIAVIFCSIALWIWWSNDRHLKKAENFITSGELCNARQEIKKCGWFLAGKKQQVDKKLQLAINELINKARHWAELKDYQKAKHYLEIAIKAVEDGSEIEEQIKKYDQLEQQWEKELARQKLEQEKQRVLSEKAGLAKKGFQKILYQTLESKADIEAKDIIESAKNKAEAAEKLFGQNQFEAAEKQWLLAIKDCHAASKIAKEIRINQNETLALKLKCDQAADCARKINAPAETAEIWQEAEKIYLSAEHNFSENNFDLARKLWKQAADKYRDALQATMQSPNYKKALLMRKKWQHLKSGLREKDVRHILGRPKCVQAASDHSIWYYQATPKFNNGDGGNYEYINPQNGYIRFETMSIETILERNKEAYEKSVKVENTIHEKYISQRAEETIKEKQRHNEKTSKIERAPIDEKGRKIGSYKTVQERCAAESREDRKHSRKVQGIEKSIVREDSRHQRRLEKLKKNYSIKINDLVKGLSPREPHYIVSDWKLPNQDDLLSLLRPEKTEKRKIKPGNKWQMPIKWKALRLNIKKNEAYSILGRPDKIVSKSSKKICSFGTIADYGVLIFEDCTDSVIRLRYWKEPLWDQVAQQLETESRSSDPNQTISQSPETNSQKGSVSN